MRSSQPSLSELEAPDYIEPLCAYRAWQLCDAFGQHESAWRHRNAFGKYALVSINGDSWEPGVAKVAKCNRIESGRRLPHPASEIPPVPDCSCGIYAGKNLEHLIEINYAQFGIHGEVSLWGRVMEHELGYRAQYAYPRYFVIPPWLMINDMRHAESRLDFLSQFNIDIYVAGELEVSRDMRKTLLKPAGGEVQPEGMQEIMRFIQEGYSTRSKVPKLKERDPGPGDRLAITGKGISIITAVNAETVVAMLYNTMICTVPRKDVRWDMMNFRFECTPSSFSMRARPQY